MRNWVYYKKIGVKVMTLDEYKAYLNFIAKIYQTINTKDRLKEDAIQMTNGSAEIKADASYAALDNDIKALYEAALLKLNAFKA